MSIKAEHLTYKYGDGTAFEQYALKDVNFEIPDGQFVGLIGHTGSGKSTLIQHLNGLIKPTSGRILYNGTDIHSEGYSLKKLRSKVGLVFQYPEHQLFEIDVLADVAFGPKNLGLSQEEAKKRAIEALQLVGIKEEQYTLSPFELSGGQKRRVAIAGVLAMQPEVLILDEPAAGLDPGSRREILDTIAHLYKETGMTVILSSHSMEDMAEYARRLLVMNQGELVMDGTPKEIFGRYKELEKMGHVSRDEDGSVTLTPSGERIAAEIYERHRFFTQRLIAAGVDPETAAKEACHMEHGVSEESFQKLKEAAEG